VLLAASRKEKVEDRVACAEAADLKPLVMDIETFAAQAAYELVISKLPDGGKEQNIALVDIGANAMKVTIMREAEPIYTREQAFGGGLLTQDIMRAYGMSADEAESLKRSGAGPDNYQSELLQPFLENLALEVSRALQFFFTSTQHTEVSRIVLSGGCAITAGIEEIVSARTEINAMVANPFIGMTTSPRIRAKQLAADAPSLMVACGLALRRFDQ